MGGVEKGRGIQIESAWRRVCRGVVSEKTPAGGGADVPK